MGDVSTDGCKFLEFNDLAASAIKKLGGNLSAPKLWEEQLEAKGFINITAHWMNWPVGPWAKGEKNKIIGKLLHQNFYKGIETVVPLLKKVHQWDSDRIDNFTKAYRAEFNNQKVHLYMETVYIYAQKPPVSEPEQPNA
jgi:hypothetical protein